MNRGDLGTPIVPVPSIGNKDTHGISSSPGSHESRESHESDHDLIQSGEGVVVSYPMQDGTPFYFMARKADVQNHREGTLSTTDLLSRSG